MLPSRGPVRSAVGDETHPRLHESVVHHFASPPARVFLPTRYVLAVDPCWRPKGQELLPRPLPGRVVSEPSRSAPEHSTWNNRAIQCIQLSYRKCHRCSILVRIVSLVRDQGPVSPTSEILLQPTIALGVKISCSPKNVSLYLPHSLVSIVRGTHLSHRQDSTTQATTPTHAPQPKPPTQPTP